MTDVRMAEPRKKSNPSFKKTVITCTQSTKKHHENNDHKPHQHPQGGIHIHWHHSIMKLSLALTILLTAEGGVTAFSFVALPKSAAAAIVPRLQRSAATTTTSLWGILDEIQSDDYNLLSSSSTEVDMGDAYETFLADLVFSTNDPRIDIMNKFELAGDDDFIAWLRKKVETSKDPEERIALKDLLDMIVDIKTRVKVNQLAEERAAKEAQEAEQARLAQAESDAEKGRSMTMAEILKKATQIDTAEMGQEVSKKGVEKKKSFYEQEITPEIRLSYESLLNKILPPYKPGESPASIAFNEYDQFDAQVVKLLTERSNNGDVDAEALLKALANEQQKRIAAATQSLKSVLALGDPRRMEGAIVKLAREGKIDEPFLLLLEANENQATQAGANGPAQLMARLRRRAMEEKDKQSASKEIRLLRQLLRTEEFAEREKLLEEAFTPKNALLVPGTPENAQKALEGEAPEQEQPMPEVPPPDFINACKAVLLNFGNLGYGDGDERGDLATRIKKLASEAEVVATRIYGQGMTLREQQDRAWKEQTTSIFDLELMEMEAEQMGESAPWANPNTAGDDMMMPGFDADGRMKIGGT
jgi:hypothetical protein